MCVRVRVRVRVCGCVGVGVCLCVCRRAWLSIVAGCMYGGAGVFARVRALGPARGGVSWGGFVGWGWVGWGDFFSRMRARRLSSCVCAEWSVRAVCRQTDRQIERYGEIKRWRGGGY